MSKREPVVDLQVLPSNLAMPMVTAGSEPARLMLRILPGPNFEHLGPRLAVWKLDFGDLGVFDRKLRVVRAGTARGICTLPGLCGAVRRVRSRGTRRLLEWPLMKSAFR